jgi:hypothetical protein
VLDTGDREEQKQERQKISVEFRFSEYSRVNVTSYALLFISEKA